jgi:hypothetical protein
MIHLLISSMWLSNQFKETTSNISRSKSILFSPWFGKNKWKFMTNLKAYVRFLKISRMLKIILIIKKALKNLDMM